MEFEIGKLRDMILAAHSDADGVTSAVLTAKAGLISQVFFPEEFGSEVHQNGKLTATMMVDMRPKNPEWDGYVVDHHPMHPPPEARKYKLIWDSVPASLILYTLLKDKIPEEEHWKVIVGLGGDGQLEATPSEIWKKFPILLEEYGNIYTQYGKSDFRGYPVYILLSSYINSACRVNQPTMAFQILYDAKSPFDILRNPDLLSFKEALRKEVKAMLENPVIQIGRIRILIYNSEFRLGYLASKITDDFHTGIAVNVRDGHFSVRGVLANLLVEALNENNIECGGHPGFAGGRLQPHQTVDELIDVVRDVVSRYGLR